MNYTERTVATTLLATAIKLINEGGDAAETEASIMIAKASGYLNPVADNANCESLEKKGITHVAGLRDHFAEDNRANGCASQGEPGVTVGESRLNSLETAEHDLHRLVTLIGLHDGAVGINAPTSELSAEIAALIAKRKA